MKGGPSHVDTFDPKPLLDSRRRQAVAVRQAPRAIRRDGQSARRPRGSSRSTAKAASGSANCFPHVASHVDDLCMIHSVHGTNPAHGGALLKLHTGSDNFIRPSIGSWVSYGLGTENANLPAFVTICPTLAHGGINNWSSAFLPAVYQGTPLGNASVPSDQARVKYIANSRLSREMQRLQLDRLAAMNREHLTPSWPGALAGSPHQFVRAGVPHADGAAARSKTSPAKSAATQKLYGLDDPVTANFGRMCLMARRFAEAGVRFIQVTHSDSKVQWDQHSDLKNGHEKNAREVDLPIAGLLQDLKARGLLEDTLVWWGGEFGRTPVVRRQQRPRPQPRRLHDVARRRRREGRPALRQRPTTTATTPPRTRSTSTTCTPRFCTCSASTTNGSPTATPAATSA